MRRALLMIAVGAALFAGLVFAYSVTGNSRVVARSDSVSDGVNLIVDLMSVDTAGDQVTLRILPLPVGSYLNPADDSFAVPLRVTARFAVNDAVFHEIPAGQPVGGSFDVVLPVDGKTQNYPFDRYNYSFDDPVSKRPVIPAPLVTIDRILPDGRGTQPVAVGPALNPQGLTGWAEEWRLVANGSTLSVVLLIQRSGGVLGFVFLVVTLVSTLSILALTVGWAVATRRRPVEPTFASWFAALLFALIPLRNFLPGAPPIGAWIDVWVFYWVELILLTAMALFITSWFRYREPPDYSHLGRPSNPESTGGGPPATVDQQADERTGHQQAKP